MGYEIIKDFGIPTKTRHFRTPVLPLDKLGIGDAILLESKFTKDVPIEKARSKWNARIIAQAKFSGLKRKDFVITIRDEKLFVVRVAKTRS